MPSTTSSSVSSDFASSTVITPSLPTFFMASARKRPISASPLAEMVATWAISSFEVTFLEFRLRSATTASTAMSTPRLRSIGFMPAATALAPSRTMACASTVAVVVPSPATSEVLLATSRTIWAPMFSRGSLSSISFATVTPSLVMRGEPYFLSRTTFRPLGPRVTLTASARRLTPRRIDCRDSSPYVICFAIGAASIFLEKRLRQHGQDFVFAEDQDLLAVDLDVGPRVLPEQDLVAHLDVQGDLGPVLQELAVPDGQDLALLGLFLRRVRDDDAPLGGHLFLDAANEQAVVKRTYFHHGQFPFDRRTAFGTGMVRSGQRAAETARLIHARPAQGKPWRMKTSATIDIGAAKAAISVRRFDTKPVMEASLLNEDLLW